MTTTSSATDSLVDLIERDGWAVTPPLVSGAALDDVLGEVAAVEAGRGGLRDLLTISPAVRRLARLPVVRDVAEAVLGTPCFAVRGILFDKTEATNWKVAWHQDLTIAVQEQIDVPGFGPWSIKNGIVHVQPPLEVLHRMLAVRIHVDDCTADNGPLRVISGSHLAGRLSASDIETWTGSTEPVTCVAERGAVLAFHPLLLHASSAAIRPRHRRVVHLEFASGELPGGLQWHCRA